MSLTISGLLALASALSSAMGSGEDAESQREYDDKVKAWQEYNDRIDEMNRNRSYKQQRRATMARAVGSDIPIMPQKDFAQKGRSELPDKPESSTWTDMAGALGTASSLTGSLGTNLSDIPLVGTAYDAVGDYFDEAARKAATAWSAPDIGRDYQTYDYTQRYNPKRYLSGE